MPRAGALAALLPLAGVGGTPTFVANGTKVLGSGGLAAAIEGSLPWAEQSGIPRSEYYDRAVLGL